MTTTWRAPTLLVVLGLLATACGSGSTPGPQPSPTPSGSAQAAACTGLVSDLVGSLQTYVDAYADMTLEDLATMGDPPSDVDLDERFATFRSDSQAAGCTPEQLESSLAVELTGLQGEGEAGQAIADSLRQSILDPESQQRFTGTESVGPDDDLLETLGRAGAGATIFLQAGDHQVDQPLVLDRSITLRGAGRDETRIVSTAEGAAVVALGDADVTIEQLTIAHEGDAASSPLVVRSVGYRIHDARFSGGVADAQGAGGSGVVIGVPVPRPLPPIVQGPRTHPTELADVEVVDNVGGGLAIVGTEAPTIERIVARGNGACGVCFVGAQGGALRDSTVEANRVGVSVGESSEPHLQGNTITGNTEAGIAFDGYGGGTAQDNTIEDNGGVGVLVSSSAAPTLAANRVAGHGQVGIAVAGEAQPRIRDNDLVDNDVGLQAADRSAPTVTGNTISGEGRAALLFAGSAQGNVEANTCDGPDNELVLIESSDPQLGDNDCEVTDQR